MSKKKYFIFSLPFIVLLILVIIYPIQALYYITQTQLLAFIGLFFCSSLSLIGNAHGLSIIGTATSGTSIVKPNVRNQAIVCFLICEGCFILGFVNCLLLTYGAWKSEEKNLISSVGSFASGVVMGGTAYAGCYGCGKVAAYIITTEGKRPGYFATLLFPLLICCSFSVFGFVLGFRMKSIFGPKNY